MRDTQGAKVGGRARAGWTRICKAAALCGFMLLVCSPPEPAAGATATATMSVSATVQATCTISTTDTVGLNAGTGTSPTATVTTRHMMGPSSAELNYVLTQDSAHATNWGNTPGTDTPASANGTGSAVNLTVYGQIAAGQYVTPGSYSDTVTATVNF